MEDSSSDIDSEEQIKIDFKRVEKKKFGKIGNCVGFFFDNKGMPLLTIGPDWPLCACVILVFGFLDLFILYYLNLELWLKIIGSLISIVFLSCFLMTSLLNPGITFQSEEIEHKDEEGSELICKKCNIVFKARTWHCDDCNLCVEELDHHCPWTGKCIAKNNVTCFYSFLIVLFFNLIYIVLVFTIFIDK